MKKQENIFEKINGIFLMIIFLLTFTLPVFSGSHYKYAIKKNLDTYFGHISYIENQESRPIVYKEDQLSPEYAVLNFPIAPGNTIQTQNKGRCEIQFDTGTILRLEENTEIKLETVLAQSLSSRKKMTNLVLKEGSVYVMYKSYMVLELFQVMTPNAALNIDKNSVALLSFQEDGTTEIEVIRGKVSALYGLDENSLEQEKIKQSQAVRIGKEHKLEYIEETPSSDFISWNKSINKNFQELHEGKSPIPKPVYRYPDAVIYFAEKYSTVYGEWIWDDFYGYVWRPFHYRYYPSGWHPYSYGQWTAVNGQMFWVPREPWGWAPYHLGVWTWHQKKGWLWIPGSVFSPAWVCWDYVIRPGMLTGYFMWRPWTVLDWADWSFMHVDMMPEDEDSGSGMPDPGIHHVSFHDVNQKNNPRFILAGSLKKIFKNVKKALKQGERDFFLSYSHISRSISLVKHEFITSPNIHEKIINMDEFGKDVEKALSQLSQDELHEKIVEAFHSLNSSQGMRKSVRTESGLNTKGLSKAVSLPMIKEPVSTNQEANQLRFRDWNPDIKVAGEMGVSIIYSGSRNEIVCPELRLSSGNVRISTISKISSGSSFYSAAGRGGKISGVSSTSHSGSKSLSTTSKSGEKSSSGKK